MSKSQKHIVIDARVRRASTGRYAQRLVEHLQKIDKTNRYSILVEPGDNWKMQNSNFKTVSCHFQQFSFNPIEQIAFSWQLYRLHPDVVHFTMTQQPLFYFDNIVTTTHDLTMLRHTRPSRFHPIVHRLGMVLYRFLMWWTHKKSKTIIVPSEFVAEDLADYQPFTAKKTRVIYEAADPPIKEASKELKGVKKPFIFHVGAPYPHKNLDKLVEAFNLIKRDSPQLRLVLPGKMKDQFKKDFEHWVEASPVRDAIIAPGFVDEAQLKWLYENAEAYVLPSLSEGFGLPGLEAMAHSCPLVSSKATCLPEIYGDAAEYFDPENIEDIATAITGVISDKNRQQELVSIGKKQLQRYSWQQTAQQTLEIY